MIIQDPSWLCGECLFVKRLAAWQLAIFAEPLSLMPGGFLNINLSKIKVNLKLNFNYLKVRLLFR